MGNGVMKVITGAKDDDKNTRMFRVTEIGQERIDNNSGEGMELETLQYINNQGTCTISDVVRGTHKDRVKVEFVMKKLLKMGCIKRIN
jgi:hypothetical protein